MPAISSTISSLAELEGTSHKSSWRYVPRAKSACFTRFEKGEISGAKGKPTVSQRCQQQKRRKAKVSGGACTRGWVRHRGGCQETPEETEETAVACCQRLTRLTNNHAINVASFKGCAEKDPQAKPAEHGCVPLLAASSTYIGDHDRRNKGN